MIPRLRISAVFRNFASHYGHVGSSEALSHARRSRAKPTSDLDRSRILLDQLGWTTTSERLPELVEQGVRENMTLTSFLDLVPQSETSFGEENRVKTWLKHSRLPIGKTLEDFDKLGKLISLLGPSSARESAAHRGRFRQHRRRQPRHRGDWRRRGASAVVGRPPQSASGHARARDRPLPGDHPRRLSQDGTACRPLSSISRLWSNTVVGRKYFVRSVMPPDDRRDAGRQARAPPMTSPSRALEIGSSTAQGAR
jgi:hypothetical protein